MKKSNTKLSTCQRLEQFGKDNSEYNLWIKHFLWWQKLSLFTLFIALAIGMGFALKVFIFEGDKYTYNGYDLGDIYYLVTLLILLVGSIWVASKLAPKYRKGVFNNIYSEDYKGKTEKTISNKDIREKNLFVFFAENNISHNIENYKILRDEFMLHKNYNTFKTNIIPNSVAIFAAVFLAFLVEQGYGFMTTEFGNSCEVIRAFAGLCLSCSIMAFVLIKLFSYTFLSHLKNINQKYIIVLDLLGQLILENSIKNK